LRIKHVVNDFLSASFIFVSGVCVYVPGFRDSLG
jgi:hypothetical protein